MTSGIHLITTLSSFRKATQAGVFKIRPSLPLSAPFPEFLGGLFQTPLYHGSAELAEDRTAELAEHLASL